MEFHKCKPSPISSTSETGSCSSRSTLRRELSSVAWIQCDKCLKWRKVEKEVAENFGDSNWTCDMNINPDYQSCDASEEDTAHFDRLAKKAKLDLIRSEMKPGTLVWAKLDGYCRWPALITQDPAGSDHCEGDGEEILWYHVEFLGTKRSHCWVKTERVEVFGLGNCQKLEKDSNEDSSKKRGRKKQKGRAKILKQRTKYKGSDTLRKAISEGVKLIALSTIKRLETTWFSSRSTKDLSSVEKKRKGLTIQKQRGHDEPTSKHKRKSSKCKRKDEPSTPDRVAPKAKLNKRKRKNFDQIGELDHSNKKLRFQVQSVKPSLQLNEISNSIETTPTGSENVKKGCNYSCGKSRTGIGCLNFPSSLVSATKEERFLLDVQMYRKNEKAFQYDVAQFMFSQSLRLSAPPVWHDVRVSLFSIFLAVYERGGFELVSGNHTWGDVYNEITHQYAEMGSIVVKTFYKENLLAYEQYVTGQDYSSTVKAQKQASGKLYRTSKCVTKRSPYVIYDGSQSSCSSMIAEDETLSDEAVSEEYTEHVYELDDIFRSFDKEQKENDDCCVPNIVLTNQPLHSNQPCAEPVELIGEMVATASVSGKAQEPEEKAQVVPELDFPSSISSDEGSSQAHDLHDMQALQLDAGEVLNYVAIICD